MYFVLSVFFSDGQVWHKSFPFSLSYTLRSAGPWQLWLVSRKSHPRSEPGPGRSNVFARNTKTVSGNCAVKPRKKKASADCSRKTLKNWPAKCYKQNATQRSNCATRKQSTTRRCAGSNVILTWPKPGFSDGDKNRRRISYFTGTRVFPLWYRVALSRSL